MQGKYLKSIDRSCGTCEHWRPRTGAVHEQKFSETSIKTQDHLCAVQPLKTHCPAYSNHSCRHYKVKEQVLKDIELEYKTLMNKHKGKD